MTTTAPAHRLSRNARYITWLVSDTAKGLASALVGFAIPLIALFVTDDPAQAGIIGAVGMTVRTVTTIYGGVLADRHRRIRMMVTGSLLGGILALADALTFATLLVIEVLLAARTGLFDVAGESALKEIVPADAMGRAQAANQGRDALLQLAGGPLGGLLLAAGAWVVGAVMVVCQSIAGLTAWMLGRRDQDRASDRLGASDAGEGRHAETGPKSGTAEAGGPARAKPSALREAREGFTWLFRRPDLRGVLFVATVINLGFSAALTTVTYALQQAGHSTVTIGLLGTAAGAGMLVGALLAPALVTRVPSGLIVTGGLAVATVAVSTLIVVHDPLAIAAVMVVTVFFIPAVNAALGGYAMVATPTELLGRVNSASMVLGLGAVPFAPLIAGFGLAAVGRGWTLVIAAALCAVAVLLAVTNRGLRALPVESGWTTHAAQFVR